MFLFLLTQKGDNEEKKNSSRPFSPILTTKFDGRFFIFVV